MFRALALALVLLFTSSLNASVSELALNWKAEPEFGGFYAAIDILKKQGTELKIQEGGSGTPTIQMLAAKKIPFAIVSADELITARDRGMNLVAVFAVYQINPQGIMAREDSPWTSLEQLINDPKATLAVQMGLPYVAYLKKKFPKMKAKLVPYQGGIGPFLAQKNYAQQCFMTAEPLAANRAGLKTKNFTLDAIGFNPYLAVVAVHKDSLIKTKAEVESIVQAFRKGWESYLTNPAEVDKLMNKLNPSMSLETFAESGRAQLKLIKPDEAFIIGSMTSERWRTLSLQLKDLNLIKKVQSPENYFVNF
jgi:NitT/TauT family transport system substrate-binding protein